MNSGNNMTTPEETVVDNDLLSDQHIRMLKKFLTLVTTNVEVLTTGVCLINHTTEEIEASYDAEVLEGPVQSQAEEARNILDSQKYIPVFKRNAIYARNTVQMLKKLGVTELEQGPCPLMSRNCELMENDVTALVALLDLTYNRVEAVEALQEQLGLYRTTLLESKEQLSTTIKRWRNETAVCTTLYTKCVDTSADFLKLSRCSPLFCLDYDEGADIYDMMRWLEVRGVPVIMCTWCYKVTFPEAFCGKACDGCRCLGCGRMVNCSQRYGVRSGPYIFDRKKGTFGFCDFGVVEY